MEKFQSSLLSLLTRMLKTPNAVIAGELLKWFRGEAVLVPWVKETKKVDV